jgi:alpha-beta hydrolase superfamily lysophospholipase
MHEVQHGISMHTLRARWKLMRRHRPRWLLRGGIAALATLMTCVCSEAQQRKWIFQASGAGSNQAGPQHGLALQDRWIQFQSEETGDAVKLHALWLAHGDPDAPVLLYLHGARWDLGGSAARMQHLHALGFSVLGIDYRGFGRSTPALPSERMACEDARAAWQWLAQRHGASRRFIYGHSLGGAIAVQLAASAEDVSGLMVEGTFTSIPELFGTLAFGWLPITALIKQRFDAAERVAELRAPLLVMHGSDDELIHPDLGRALYERATVPKRFLLVEGGSHCNTHELGHAQCRDALRELFGLQVG